MSAATIARAAVALVAVLTLAWLGVMERDSRLQSGAVKSARAGKAVRAVTDLRRARLLNPDSAPDLTRGALYLGLGHRRRAVATVEAVLRDEPDNLAGWTSLLLIARGYDPNAERRARAAIHRLDPLDARRLVG